MFFIWSIWKERNQRTWENQTTVARDLYVLESAVMFHFFQSHNAKYVLSKNSRSGFKWRAPLHG